MGTYSDSAIVTARKPKTCAECKHTIEAGQRKLNFKVGLKRQVEVHASCATNAFRKRGDWRCAVIEREATDEAKAGVSVT
jgi:hypothetical protein